MPRMYYFSGLSSSRQYSRSGLSSWVLEETKWLPRISWPARLFFIVRFVYTSIWDTKRVEEPSRFSPGWRTRNLQQDENQKVIGQLDYWPGRSRWWRNVGREFFQIPLDCLKIHDTRCRRMMIFRCIILCVEGLLKKGDCSDLFWLQQQCDLVLYRRLVIGWWLSTMRGKVMLICWREKARLPRSVKRSCSNGSWTTTRTGSHCILQGGDLLEEDQSPIRCDCWDVVSSWE